MSSLIRPVGQITTDMEPLIQELAIDHQLQVNEIFALLLKYLAVHCPDSLEEYVDGGGPILYGYSKLVNDKRNIKNIKKGFKK